jgi:phosphomannomutase/phosphoglucomutase
MAKINQNIFREYDIRGLADEDLRDDVVELLGKAYGTYMKGTPVIVGHDNRLSSERIKQALVKGLTSTGSDVIDIGLTLSPIFYFSRILYKNDGGMMITASHNPKEYNGFKICRGEHTIYGEEIKKIGQIAEKGEFITGQGKVTKKDPTLEYRKVLKEKIKLAKKLKVVLDCGNGTASIFAPQILKDWGCEVIPLHCTSDGNFPNHTPDPVKVESAQDLIKKVKETKADLGIGIDGDGDRIGVVDEQGNMIFGDILLILYYREFLAKHAPAKAIVEVKCSQALHDDIIAHGGKPMFYKTGHSLIKAKMSEEGVLLTGEMSGHMFFKDEFYGTDDALYAAGRLLRILSQTDKKLSELLQDVPKYYSTPEMRLYCPDEEKFDITKKLVNYFKQKYEVIDIDGARIIFDDGWGLIRSSNTQPALIVRAEGKTPESLVRIKKVLFDKLREFPSVKLGKKDI